MILKFHKVRPDAKLPVYQSPLAAGIDLHACIPHNVQLNGIHVIHTGISVEMPMYHFGRILDRSGLATKGVHVLAGVIDEDYRGEISVVLTCLATEKYVITPGERIAQLVIMPWAKCMIIEAEGLSKTERGASGFGSTGKE